MFNSRYCHLDLGWANVGLIQFGWVITRWYQSSFQDLKLAKTSGSHMVVKANMGKEPDDLELRMEAKMQKITDGFNIQLRNLE